MKRRQVKPLAASLLDALDYDSSDDSDFEVGDASGKHSLHNVLRALMGISGEVKAGSRRSSLPSAATQTAMATM